MTRSFDGTPVDTAWLEDLCASALWAPTAGNSAGVRLNVVGPEHVASYLEVATDASWRDSSRRYSGLARAGAVVLVTTRPGDYLDRYAEPDKAASGLGDVDAWPLPYWHADAAMATMALLLLLEESDWQATLWGSFRHADGRALVGPSRRTRSSLRACSLVAATATTLRRLRCGAPFPRELRACDALSPN